MSSLSDHGARVRRLAGVLAEQGCDAFLASSPITMGFLHGFHEGGGERFVALAVNRDGRHCLVCPGLSATQARRAGIQDVRPWNDGEDPMDRVRELAEEWSLRTAVIAVEDDMRADALLALQKALPAALFQPARSVLAEFMGRKEPWEVDRLRRAGRIADAAYEALLGWIRPGLTEREVAAGIEREMTERGGGPGFCIVAAGANGAEPHHLNDDTVLREGDVVVLDFGCSVDRYPSDITRTVCLGKASDEAKRVYDAVYRAHLAGREAARLGAPCQEVDRAARRVIEQAGYGEWFMHRTGHGIGLRGHEDPYMVEGNETPLAVGHCFSVEPGVYLPGRFGVRVENIVTMEEGGCVSLNAEPPEALPELPV
ncbi:MAG: Xaa-Pro peptidase family protein [Fimbriimonadales bacterium]|nr:Xaa-Pro peptidase family protein [Fimbriimonadales bacterium]